MSKKRTKTVKHTIAPRTMKIGTGVDLVVTLPLSCIDSSFVEEMCGDIRAAYNRAMERSWERFERLTRSGKAVA
jgi:hypothetical protein